MTHKELITFVEREYKKCVDIMRKKNSDYSRGDDDALRNFKSITLVGLDPKTAFLNHLTTKITRIGNLLFNEAEVKDESIDDTLTDLSNYAMLLKAYLHEIRKTKKRK